MEGLWDTTRGAPMTLIAWPDMGAETNLFAIDVPNLASVYLTHSWNGEIQGLKAVPPADRPYVPIVFFAFRTMVGIGIVLLATAVTGAVLRRRGRLFDTRWFLQIVSQTWWVGFVAVIAGWVVTESGRQPWTVHGILRTADAISPVPAASVAVTLALFVIVYGIVFAMGIYYINRLIVLGPQPPTEQQALVRSPMAAAGGADTFQKGG